MSPRVTPFLALGESWNGGKGFEGQRGWGETWGGGPLPFPVLTPVQKTLGRWESDVDQPP